MRMRSLLGVAILMILASPADAQLPVGTALDDYHRLMQVTGAVPARSVTARPSLALAPLLEGTGGHNPWQGLLNARRTASATVAGSRVDLLPISLDIAYNSARPWGVNDGPVWQGRGHTAAISGGIELRRGRFSAALRPTIIRSGNRDFTLSPIPGNTGLSPFAYPTGLSQTIDMPQRFGAEPFTTFDLGQSFVRAEFGPVALGLSNESMWWGPGRLNSISMSNNAPGFGHAFLATARPTDIGIGKLSSRWVWSRLRESGYFDADASNDSRFMTGIVASLSPDGVPGLEVGATRTFLLDWRDGGPSFREATSVFIPLQKKTFVTAANPTGDDRSDQMASLFFRWAMPQSRFEVYGEWGRGDHSWDIRDLLVEPEHTSGFIAGIQKASQGSPDGFWRFAAEMTVLGAARTSTLRAPASGFYVHHLIKQGYTQRGQVIGAGIGPGSSQASFAVHRFAPWGRAGVRLQRTVLDNNRFYALQQSFRRHEVEPALAADLLLFRGAWDIGASVTLARLLNRYYIERNDQTNVNLGIVLRYHP